jgi:hypothetical protein
VNTGHIDILRLIVGHKQRIENTILPKIKRMKFDSEKVIKVGKLFYHAYLIANLGYHFKFFICDIEFVFWYFIIYVHS